MEEGFHQSNHGSMAPAPRGLEIAFFFFFFLFYYYCSYSTGTPECPCRIASLFCGQQLYRSN